MEQIVSLGARLPGAGVALEARGLTFSYGSNTVFDGIACRIPEGAVIGMIGPNGSGKTTFFDLATGLLAPRGGTLNRDAKPEETAYLLQYMNFPAALRIGEIALLIHEFQACDSASTLEDLVSSWDGRSRQRFEKLRRRRAGVCSYGELRWLAASMILGIPGKRLVILDEPTTGVDPEFRYLVWRQVAACRERGGSIVVSSHRLEEMHRYVDAFYFVGKRSFRRFDSLEAFLAAHDADDPDEAFVRAAEFCS